jgi:hypothetical protein
MAIEDLLPDDPLDEPPSEDRGKGFVPDFVRRLAWAGLGAVFMSEEGIRRLGSQLKLPKEALSYLLSQAEKTKDEVGRVVTEEVRKLLQSERLRDELVKLISQMTIEVKAEVRLVPDRARDQADAPEPTVKVTELKTKYSSRKKPDREPSAT